MRLVFQKPIKNKILLYDGNSIERMNFFSKKYSVFYNRYEEINIYVLFYTIIKNGLINLKVNYKINYFKFVSPKLVITFIDENPGFFKLKNLYKHCKYISVQSFFKKKYFFKYIKNYKIKNKDYIFYSDYIFILNKSEFSRYSKSIKGKIFYLGNVYNNYYFNNNNKIDTKSLIFISSWKYENRKSPNFKRFTVLFNNLCNYCKRNNLKLFFLSKDNKKYEKDYREIFKSNQWIYIPRTSSKNTYKIINKYHFFISDISTLAYEAFAKNKRIIVFPPKKFPYEGYNKNYPNNGPFWSTQCDFKNLSKKINYVRKLPNKKWTKLKNYYSKEFIFYSKQNFLLKKYIKKITLTKTQYRFK